MSQKTNIIEVSNDGFLEKRYTLRLIVLDKVERTNGRFVILYQSKMFESSSIVSIVSSTLELENMPEK